MRLIILALLGLMGVSGCEKDTPRDYYCSKVAKVEFSSRVDVRNRGQIYYIQNIVLESGDSFSTGIKSIRLEVGDTFCHNPS